MTKMLGHQLREAASSGNLAAVKQLIEGDVPVNDRSSFNNTALLYAAMHGKRDCVHFLIDNGADVNIANNTGYTPLFCAALIGSAEIVKILLEAGAEGHHATRDEDGPVDTQPHTALFVAERNNRHQVVELLKAAEARLRLSQEEHDEAGENIDCRPNVPYAELPL